MENQDKERRELEAAIIKMVYDDNKCVAQFEYDESVRGDVGLTLTTFNPSHKLEFLLQCFAGDSKESCLKKALQFLKHAKKESNSYTVTWSYKDNTSITDSYFVGNTMLEVLQKFYHGRGEEDFRVYNCKMNPIA